MTAPGVYFDARSQAPALPLETGVPAFVGKASPSALGDGPGLLALDASGLGTLDAAAFAGLDRLGWVRRAAWDGTGNLVGALAFAVRGFFENGGRRCYVVPRGLDDPHALEPLHGVDDFDLIAAPDTAGSAADQTKLLDACDRRTDCFAILDAAGAPLPTATLTTAALQAELGSLPKRANGALYGPWIKVREACPVCAGTGINPPPAACTACAGTGQGFAPPSGHVAGVFARTDAAQGVQKAPANETVLGAFDLEVVLDGDLAPLNPIRAFPGRGVRVYGARTLAAGGTAFDYVNARRVYLTVARWLESSLAGVAFEPNDMRLWARIGRQVGAYLDGLYRGGALFGATADEAYYVRCDAETNPPALRDLGQVVTEVGLALAQPNEFVKVSLVSTASGAAVAA